MLFDSQENEERRIAKEFFGRRSSGITDWAFAFHFCIIHPQAGSNRFAHAQQAAVVTLKHLDMWHLVKRIASMTDRRILDIPTCEFNRWKNPGVLISVSEIASRWWTFSEVRSASSDTFYSWFDKKKRWIQSNINEQRSEWSFLSFLQLPLENRGRYATVAPDM